MQSFLHRLSRFLPALSLGIVGGLAVWSQTVTPGKGSIVLFGSIVYFAFVLLLEYRWRAFPHRAVASHRVFLRTYFFAMAMVFLFGPGADLLDASHPVDPAWINLSHRISGMLFGVALALWGNFLPKLPSPWRLEEEPFDWQGVHRFIGWAHAIAGTVVFFGWLMRAPHDANRLAILVVMTAALLGVGRKLYSVATWKTARRP